MHISEETTLSHKDDPYPINFSKQFAVGSLAHENDPIVIKVQIWDRSVKRFLVGPRISADVLYWDVFKGMNFDIVELLPFNVTLIVLCGEHVQVLGHLPVLTTFRSRANAKKLWVRYLIINATSLYNVIIEIPSFNALKSAFSTLYLIMK